MIKLGFVMHDLTNWTFRQVAWTTRAFDLRRQRGRDAPTRWIFYFSFLSWLNFKVACFMSYLCSKSSNMLSMLAFEIPRSWDCDCDSWDDLDTQ